MSLTVTAPGKVILFGEHAVCFGKEAIATALDRKTTVEIDCSSQSDYLCLNLIDLIFFVKWPLSQLSKIKLELESSIKCDDGDNQGIAGYHDDIGKKLYEIVLTGINCSNNGDIKNDIASKNDVILSAIESSKSFLFLYFSMASSYLKQEQLIPMEVKLSSNVPVGAGLGSSSAFSVSLSGALLKCFLGFQPDNQLINKWAFQSERLFHGKPSGIDNNIAVAGGTLMFKDDSIYPSTNMRLKEIVLVDTQVKRNTKTLVSSTISRRQMFPEIINNVMDAIGDISRKSWQYLNGDDSYDFKTLVEINQCLLNCLGAGHSAIDQVLSIAKKYGFQGKLTGAGGGGSVIIFIEDVPGESVEDMLYQLNSNGFKAQTIKINCPGISFQ
ncbi:mevalonate kinase-like [Panonychus citri]|uniref:mevalonate kinase-like n=1 Tax=Panonychus citri TaxID=50023 RepID=UPI0023075344|nr:mevalonate kinase-like [Panonychus citri]